MRALTWSDFADAAGSAYQVAVGAEQFELTLEQATEIESAGREGGSFRLDFVGPSDPILPQAIYPFRRGAEEPFEIFIVPVGRDSKGTRYEAIFF
jgi:hypothetical protein